MRYSKRLKRPALKKVLPLENRSIAKVAREFGISKHTIYRWKKMVENDKLLLRKEGNLNSTSPL